MHVFPLLLALCHSCSCYSKMLQIIPTPLFTILSCPVLSFPLVVLPTASIYVHPYAHAHAHTNYPIKTCSSILKTSCLSLRTYPHVHSIHSLLTQQVIAVPSIASRRISARQIAFTAQHSVHIPALFLLPFRSSVRRRQDTLLCCTAPHCRAS